MSNNRIAGQYRQGDVLLISSLLPDGATEDPAPGNVVLQSGVATGHKHQLSRKCARLMIDGDRRYLHVRGGKASLKHEEHGTISIPPGTYRVLLPKQYTPAMNINVSD